MILKRFQNGRPINSYCEYVVDTEADVKKLKSFQKQEVWVMKSM